MKKSTLTLMSMFAIAAMTSCQKHEAPSIEDQDGGAFVSLSVKAPSTKANIGIENGTSDESAVKSVLLYTFDDQKEFLASYSSSTANVNAPSTFAFEVRPSAAYFFAVVNPVDPFAIAATEGEAWTESFYSKISATAHELEASVVSDAANGFTMVSAGTYHAADGAAAAWTDALTSIGVNEISTDKSNPTHITIQVDRLVSRFEATLSAKFDANNAAAGFTTDAVIDGVKLNATNKKSFLFSNINVMTTGGGRYNTDYREDPNMEIPHTGSGFTTAQLDAELNWMDNKEDNVFNALTTSGSDVYEYALENTANELYYNYNNLTQAIVKATFTPASLNNLQKGDSWFAINIAGQGHTVMTLAQVATYYTDLTAGGNTNNDNIVASMDAQLKHILGTSYTSQTWATVTIAELDAIENGGYVAATVAKEEDYIVQYFQHGLNYYDIFIHHDSDIAVEHLGRWGMVRNNSYSLVVNSIKHQGLPYIPDPTDPEIKDPQNPKPTDPEPADPTDAYIDATIFVNPWTMWEQVTDLV